MEILGAPIVVTIIAVLLTAMISLAERYINNYGQCKIKINDEKEIEVEGGSTLLSTLSQQKIFIPSACGGKGSCGYCKVKVKDGGGPILPTEYPYLTKDELVQNVRLSCQVKVKKDMEIEIPEELFNVREYVATVASIEYAAANMKLITLRLPEDVKFKPGQYMQIKAPKYKLEQKTNKEEIFRAYSIASSPSQKNLLQFIVTLVPNGICSTYLHHGIKEGDSITLNGPYGDFYLRESEKGICFIATGSGLAPIRSLLYQIQENGIQRDMVFFYGGRTQKDLALYPQLVDFKEKADNFKFVPVLSKADDFWEGEKGRVTDMISKYIEDGKDYQYYLCGNPAMIDSSIQLLKKLGAEESSIFYDSF